MTTTLNLTDFASPPLPALPAPPRVAASVVRRGDGWLFLAAHSVAGAGLLVAPAGSARTAGHAAAALGATAFSMVVVYGFNRVMDAREEARVKGEAPRAASWLGPLALLLAGTAAVMAALPSALSRAALAVILAVGIVYSLSLPRGAGAGVFRLKNLYAIKNVAIGLGWGLLPVMAAAALDARVATLALFVGAQVFVGSVLRDVVDLEEDRALGVRTLPCVHGVPRTYSVLAAINLAAGALAGAVALAAHAHAVVLWLLLAVGWRAGVLAKLRAGAGPTRWLLGCGNLATCHVILCAMALARFA